jgi:hypothetical protein
MYLLGMTHLHWLPRGLFAAIMAVARVVLNFHRHSDYSTVVRSERLRTAIVRDVLHVYPSRMTGDIMHGLANFGLIRVGQYSEAGIIRSCSLLSGIVLLRDRMLPKLFVTLGVLCLQILSDNIREVRRRSNLLFSISFPWKGETTGC